MPRPTERYVRLATELLEDRITPTISFGNGSGGETPGSNAMSVAVGDLNGDGKPDLVVGTFTNGVNIFKNDGTGTFTQIGTISTATLGGTPSYMKLADMNGDGKLDLVVGSDGNNEVIICLGNGNGTFQTKHPIVDHIAHGIQDMAIADLNDDGKPDVVLGIPGGAAVLLNNGTSTILGSPAYYNPSNTPDQADVAIGDFNGDGKPDIAISVFSQNLVDVYPNNGNGTFGTPTAYSDPISASPGHLVTGDFNNDGKIDLVVSYVGTSDVGLLEGNGNGTFQNPAVIDTTISSNAITAILGTADFDHDGNLDLVVTHVASNSGVVLPGNGDGTFGTPIQASIGGASAIAIADVNGDKLPDLIAVQPDSPGSYSVTLNTSVVQFGQTTSASFATPQVASGGTEAITIEVTNSAGNAIADLTNSDFTFKLSGGTSTGTFGNVTETATPGTYTVNFSSNRIGTASSLEVTIDGVTIASESTVQVVSAIPASKSTVSFASPTVTSGTTDTATIVLKDAEGFAIAGLPSSAFSFGLLGGTSTGSFGTALETSTPGIYTANFTGIRAGSVDNLTLKVRGVQLTTHPKVIVTPGVVDAGKTTVRFAASSLVSGKTETVTIAVKDASGNAITSLSSSDFVLGLSSTGTSTGLFGTVKATTPPGTFTATFTGIAAGTATPIMASIKGTAINAQPTVTVTTGPVSASTSTAVFAISTLVSGTTEILTLAVKDAAGNAINGLTKSALALSLAGGKSTGVFGALTATATSGTYTIPFTGVLAGTASTLTVKINGVQLTTRPTVQVTPGAVNAGKSTVSFATSTVASGKADSVTIVVKDAADNAVIGLTSGDFLMSLSGGTSAGVFGTVTESSTPGTYTVVFTAGTAGTVSNLSVEVTGILLSKKPKVTVTA